jgi:lipopolysaccharide transport system permease protein
MIIKDSIIRIVRGEPFYALTRYRSLTTELTKREILGRYRGASFGMLWSIFSPFLMLMVYSFAFGRVMGNRWPQSHAGQSFSLILFVGLIVHGFLAESVIRGPTLVTGNVNYVKRIIFPLPILPWPMLISAAFHLITNYLVFLGLSLILGSGISWLAVLFPLVMVPLFILSLGVAWILAALGVYFRDISQITGVLTTALLFTSSAIVPISAIAPKYQTIFKLNPLTFIVDQARNVALWGQFPDWIGLSIYTVTALAFAYLGFLIFLLAKGGFADVL